MIINLFLTGNHIGDLCDNDYDADGTVDTLDICPSNALINRTNFFDYTSVSLYPSAGYTDPEWLILYDGLEVRQAARSDVAALMIGKRCFSFNFETLPWLPCLKLEQYAGSHDINVTWTT